MTDEVRISRYRKFFERLGEARALPVLDTLQVLALTAPETLRELETFMDRSAAIDIPTARSEPGLTPPAGAVATSSSTSAKH
jgi:hypothetical protein